MPFQTIENGYAMCYKEALDKLAAASVAYDIIKGDGSEWTQGAEDSITFTANGLFSKFSGVKVDGQIVIY